MDNRRADSAGPALRGFRLQILYTLARLTEPRTVLQATLWPEGIEDLRVKGRVESRHPATLDPAYLFPPLSSGGAQVTSP